MESKYKYWLWQSHEISKSESRHLREEHNEVVTSHDGLLAACKALMKCKLVGGTIGEAHYHIPDSVRQQAVQAMEKAIGLESVVRAAIALATKNEG